MKNVINEEGLRPIKIWTDDIEIEAINQLKNIARLPFVDRHGIACMPDVHAGIGSTVGSVVATDKAIVPSMVGVDIGCGMNAVRLSLKASQLPESLKSIRDAIEKLIPVGAGGRHQGEWKLENLYARLPDSSYSLCKNLNEHISKDYWKKAGAQLGTLGSGNHFIELCIDENQDVWVMLHSGSRGIGNMIGSYFIEKAKKTMERFFISLPDKDLAYFPEDTDDFNDYMDAVQWAQSYALENRKVMMQVVIESLRKHIPIEFTITQEAINCHHNYVEKENHFGRNLWVTRKGAIRARNGDLGIIPGSMGQRSYIVRGKGNIDSYCSCSHGAGRSMSRTEARKRFTVADLVAAVSS